MTEPSITNFSELKLQPHLISALHEVGYETPSPIQAQTIPLLLEGQDVLGQAQTGTGKTAAFALPLLSRLQMDKKPVQVLVLAPTRELAIQVAEAFQKYAKNLPGFHVLPVYGGQDYRGQIRALERGVHVVVGTPGRVMDHMRRGTLKLDQLSTLVLDEADEMLRMGFIDDVEWILDQTPKNRQIALFSATMPTQIRRIASKYLNDPAHITVKNTTSTASTIRQRYWPVSGMHKLDAITRILEAEVFDAMLIFVRTKTATIELADKLSARGYACAALNGDIPQNQREKTVENLKKGKLDILIATDVAARGLDVARISHVINYDIPHDVESYIHRIGRTGRAGRQGDAILFVAPRERRLKATIERSTGKTIEPMDLPSNEQINSKRITRFKQRIDETIANEDISFFEEMIAEYQKENDIPAEKVAAALAQLMQGDTPFLFLHKPAKSSARQERHEPVSRERAPRGSDRAERNSRKPPRTPATDESEQYSELLGDSGAKSFRDKPEPRRERASRPPESGMERFRIEVGSTHDVKPGNIVGAIANEAGIDSQYIGQIAIEDTHSFVDLPEGMPKEIFTDLKKVRVCGIPMKISRTQDAKPATSRASSNTGGDSAPKRRNTPKKDSTKAKPKKVKKKKIGAVRREPANKG